jgi:DNA-binding transcriptional LysR family regulator
MDHLRDLSLFVAVARLGSFTKAAARLAIPVSSLSRRIAALEMAIGLKLFNRSTRAVALTEAGELYLVRCENILAAVDEAHWDIHGLLGVPRGVLRLSVDAEIGSRLVAPVIAAYSRRFPDMQIEIDLSARRIDLLNENFDLAVRIGSLPDSQLRVRRLATLQGKLYAAPAYLEQTGAPAHPRDLSDHRRIHLLHQADRGEWHLFNASGTDRHEIAADSVITANNMAMIRQLAILGLGIAVLDEGMALDAVACGDLEAVLPDWALPGVALSVITPDRNAPAKTRLFVTLLAEHVSGSVGLQPV